MHVPQRRPLLLLCVVGISCFGKMKKGHYKVPWSCLRKGIVRLAAVEEEFHHKTTILPRRKLSGKCIAMLSPWRILTKMLIL
jgi:hypothetical protein